MPRSTAANSVQRSSASHFHEHDPLFSSYEHLSSLPRADSALVLLRKAGSIVKPLMRKRGWRVAVLAEFFPPEQNLLGLNINHGHKICLRLRYPHSQDLFLPLEELVDTLLHELAHIVHGPHDSAFHKLWDELRDEHEVLLRKGYTGEGFLSAGHRLGGGAGRFGAAPPPHELRRLARASAETRQAQGLLGTSGGRRLGGTPLHHGGRDIRQVIAGQAIRRNTIDRGCASGRNDAIQLSQQPGSQTFSTKAEEDDANDRAIAQALYELMEAEEEEKLRATRNPGPSEEEQMRWALAASTASSSTGDGQTAKEEVVGQTHKRKASQSTPIDLSSPPRPRTVPAPAATLAGQTESWPCPLCTFINPSPFLACEVCGGERPAPQTSTSHAVRGSTTRPPERPAKKLTTSTKRTEIPSPPVNPNQKGIGWNCRRCGAFMEHRWWTCSACGVMKESS